MAQNQDPQGPDPKLQFKHVVEVSDRNQVILEIFDNGAIATTTVTLKAGLWGGGGGGSRQCTGFCDGQKIGPINCPAGSSPVLNCISKTLFCRVNTGGSSGGILQ